MTEKNPIESFTIYLYKSTFPSGAATYLQIQSMSRLLPTHFFCSSFKREMPPSGWRATLCWGGAGSGVAAIRATMVGTRGDFRPVHKCARPTHNGPSGPTSNTSHAKGCSGSALHCEVKDRSAADQRPWCEGRCRRCGGGRKNGRLLPPVSNYQSNWALHCTALHFIALHCTALHYIALHCTALQ